MIRRFLAISIMLSLAVSLLLPAQIPETAAQTPQNPENEPLEVTFSHTSGFYAESFSLTLTAPDGAVIYYTLNGEPTSQCRRDGDSFTNIEASPVNDILYTAPIDVIAGETVDAFSVRAFAVLGDEISPVATHSFVKGIGVKSRFDGGTLVFVINSDPHGLFDYYDGIMIEGSDRQDWIDKFTERHGRLPIPGTPDEGGEIELTSPANFNRKGRSSEREVSLQVFEPDGTLRVSQQAGARVKGGYSRAHAQKSLELYARVEDYDVNRFDYPFFWENAQDGNIMNSYRRIRLRNGGSDRDGAFIRDEFGQTLLRQAGIPTTQNHTPAAVFINGAYCGVYWLKTPRTENHLRRLYGFETSLTANFRILEGSENGYGVNYWEGEPDAIDDWWEVFNLARDGLTDDESWREFSSRVCIDTMMLYYAFQIYIQNLDWPNHNMEMWRYMPTAQEKSNPDLHPYLRDGKWRWFPHDLDATWNFRNSAPANVNSLHNVLVGGGGSTNPQMQGVSAMLSAVMERPEMRGRFANTLADLIEGVCSPENAMPVFDELVARIRPEHEYALDSGAFNPANPEVPSMTAVLSNREAIREYIMERPERMLNMIGLPWGAVSNSGLGFSRDNRHPLTITTSEGGGAVMNARIVAENETVTGNYYGGTSVTVTAKPYHGYSVSHWIVGENRVDSADSITVDIDSAQNIQLYFVKNGGSCPRISVISATGGDWLEIHNPSDTVLSTKGMYLTDNSNHFRYQMPLFIIRPRESVKFKTSSNDTTKTPKRCKTNFNFAFRETLRLVAANGSVLQSADVTLLKSNQIQRLARDGNWVIESENQ